MIPDHDHNNLQIKRKNHIDILLRVAFELFGGVIAKTPAQGAATQVYVATNSIVDGVSDAYFEDCNPVTVSGDHHIFDESMAARLWTTAEGMAEGYLL